MVKVLEPTHEDFEPLRRCFRRSARQAMHYFLWRSASDDVVVGTTEILTVASLHSPFAVTLNHDFTACWSSCDRVMYPSNLSAEIMPFWHMLFFWRWETHGKCLHFKESRITGINTPSLRLFLLMWRSQVRHLVLPAVDVCTKNL